PRAHCQTLIQTGDAGCVERGAGDTAFYADEAYREAGATVEPEPAAMLGSADIVLKVNAPAVGAAGRDEIQWMRPGTFLVGSLMPLRNLEAVRALAQRRISAFSPHALPRTTPPH